MSLLEPATSASVRLNTSKGPITIELWAKEAPVICRLFLQNCLDNKYNGTKFTKIIKDYLVQIETITDPVQYDLNDEFNSRIRFNQKGLLVGVKEDESVKHNHSVDSWFITLTPTPQYNNKYNVIGKLVGESIYNVIKINHDSVDSDGNPLFPTVINSIDIIEPYFTDLEKSIVEQVLEPPKKKIKSNKQKIKLLYDEDEDEEETQHDKSFKMRSAHDLLNDKRLSSRIIPEKPSKSVTSKEKPAQSSQPAQLPTVNQEDRRDETKTNSGSTVVKPATDQKNHHSKQRLKRDPTIDSDFDPNLDFSDIEFDVNAIHSHKFIATN
jgi:cyclophilin family peptidyl-prolyl cis-trans isomerase